MSERRTIDQVLAEARARLDRLEPAAALAAQGAGTLLVDLRCADQRRESGVVPGSVHVPLSVLYWRLDPSSGFNYPRRSDPARHVVLLCADGYSSSLAAATLQDPGYARATDVIDGVTAWKMAGLPLERPCRRGGARGARPWR